MVQRAGFEPANTGPNPPEMNWDRLDLRGVNSTRNAWGYLAPGDEAIVSDRYHIYIRVDKDALKRLDNKKVFSLHISRLTVTALARCLRWAKMVKEMFEFEEEESEDEVEIFHPQKPKKRKVNLNSDCVKKLDLARRRGDSTEWDHL